MDIAVGYGGDSALACHARLRLRRHETCSGHGSFRVPRMARRPPAWRARVRGSRPGARGQPRRGTGCGMRHRGSARRRLAGTRRGRLRLGLPRRRGLPAVGQASRGAVPVERRWHTQFAGSRQAAPASSAWSIPAPWGASGFRMAASGTRTPPSRSKTWWETTSARSSWPSRRRWSSRAAGFRW